MKYFEVFKHPSGDAKAIPEGWSWMAFLFGPLWALFHAMWAVGLGVMASTFVLALALLEALPEAAELLTNLVLIATAFVFGSQGNVWRARNLRARGYAFVDSARAKSAEFALHMTLPLAPAQRHDDGNPPS